MKNSQRYFMAGVGFFSLLILASCSTKSQLKHYSGDGEPKTVPTPFFVHDGYTVQFKPIKLDKPVQLTYHFKGLPKVAWHVDVFFAIEDSREWEDKSQYKFYQRPSEIAWAETNHFKFACYDDLKGTLAMCLKDAKGNVIFQYEHKLSELIWSRAGLGPWELYDRDFKASFAADSITEYTLDVSIDPDVMLKDDEGYVLFRSGGWEPLSIGF